MTRIPGYVHDLEGLAPDYNVDIRFEERKQEGMEDRNYTYHVDRGKFDLMLLQARAEAGRHGLRRRESRSRRLRSRAS